MIRVVIRWTNTAAACNVGGPVETGVKTFDLRSMEMVHQLEDYLEARKKSNSPQYDHAECIGVEIVNV